MATTWRFGGYCACGCGQRTKLADRNHGPLGWVKDEPFEYITQHQNNKKRSKWIEQDCGYETPCHIWQGQPSQRYPSLKIKGKPVKVHLWAWEQVYGPVPVGMVVHHRCDEPRCCNPKHLEIVTQATNAHYGRSAKLTMDKANQIRALYATGAYSLRKLAEMYEVSRGTIENVAYGKTWQPVESHRPQGPPRRQD